MLKARSVAAALLGLACLTSSAAAQQLQHRQLQEEGAGASQLDRMKAWDLPLPHDWMREAADSPDVSFSFTDRPTFEPSNSFEPSFTLEPTPAVTSSPTAAITSEPTSAITSEPTAAITSEPTAAATSTPTATPPAVPSEPISAQGGESTTTTPGTSTGTGTGTGNGAEGQGGQGAGGNGPTTTTDNSTPSVPTVSPNSPPPTGRPNTPPPTGPATPAPTIAGTIPVVTIQLSLAGSPTQQDKTLKALVKFLEKRLKLPTTMSVDSSLKPGTPGDVSRKLGASPALQHLMRRMQATQGDLCTGTEPKGNATITLEGFDDTAAVEAALQEVMSGEASVLLEDETTTASETICEAETKLQLVPPSTSALDDNAAGSGGDGKPSKLASIIIGVVVAAVGVLLILFVSILAVRRRRAANSAVYPN